MSTVDAQRTHKPGTVQLYLLTFRLLLDYVGLDPNPARDPRVKLPKRVREEPQPPPAEHVEAILGAIGQITTGGSVQEFRCGLQSGAVPDAIAPRPDGNVCFTNQ